MMIPSWVNDYVGIPYDLDGRTREGLDCWGLVRMVMQERYDIWMPEFTAIEYDVRDESNHLRAIEKFCTWNKDFKEVPLESVRGGDIVVFHIYAMPLHMGVVLRRGEMLHCRQGVDTCVERYDGPLWSSRVDSVYRHVRLS